MAALRQLKQLKTGQAKENATGACTTICTYIASYFCSLKKDSPMLDDVVVSLIIRGSIRWKKFVGVFTTIPLAFSHSLMTRMCIRFEQGNYPTSFGGRHIINQRKSIECGIQLFSHPVAIFFCSQGYTYVFFSRSRGKDIFFFDPHGYNAVLDRVKDIDEMIQILHSFCNITNDAEYDMVWAQRRDRIDHFDLSN